MFEFSELVKPLIILTPMIIVGIFGYLIYEDNKKNAPGVLSEKAYGLASVTPADPDDIKVATDSLEA